MQLATRSSRDGKRDILMGVRRRLSLARDDDDCIPFFSVSWRSPIAIGSQKNIYTPVVFLLLLFSFFFLSFSFFNSFQCLSLSLSLFVSMLTYTLHCCLWNTVALPFCVCWARRSVDGIKRNLLFIYQLRNIRKRWHRHRHHIATRCYAMWCDSHNFLRSLLLLYRTLKGSALLSHCNIRYIQ